MAAPERLTSSADAVVIGGGVVGCSIAYHLARAGITNTVLLERDRLSAGTTWHSAGNMETYRSDPVQYEMVRYGVSLFPDLQAESGQELGWKSRGRVYYASHPARDREYRAVPRLAAARGLAVEYVDPQAIRDLFPIIDTSGILGGLWVPEDGSVNPTDLTTAFARAARKRGAQLHENASVTRIRVEDGRVAGVEVGGHHIECGRVVLAAGLWARDLASDCGVHLPLYALQHFYMLTESIEGLPPDLPMFLGFDDYLYGREEVGGMLVGCFDSNAMPVAERELPGDFAFELLNEEWDHFEPYMLKALDRFPLLHDTGVKLLLNGPESFTPDGHMLIGPTAEVDGLFVATGMSSCGIALSASVGRALAEWMVEGRTSLDMSRLDVRRFAAAQATEHFMRERVTEIPSFIVSMHEVGEDFATSRNIRLSPLHRRLEEAGAHFVSAGGWERALWVANGEPVEPRDAPAPWSALVDREIEQWQTSVLLIDRSTDAMIEISGPGSGGLLAALAGRSAAPEPGEAVDGVLFDDDGRVGALVAIVRPATDRFLVIAPLEQEKYVIERVRRCAREHPECEWNDASGQYACLRVIGPARGPCLADALGCRPPEASDRATLEAWPDETGQTVVWNDPWSDSSFVLCPSAAAGDIVDRLAPGKVGGPVRWGGFLAEEAFRIRHGLPAFGREISPGCDIRLQDFDCLSDERYRVATPRFRAIHHEIAQPLATIDGNAPICCDGREVGWVTSSAWYGARNRCIFMARVRADFHEAPLTLLTANRTIPLKPPFEVR